MTTPRDYELFEVGDVTLQSGATFPQLRQRAVLAL
jgi:homoserine O-acetyltransferase